VTPEKGVFITSTPCPWWCGWRQRPPWSPS